MPFSRFSASDVPPDVYTNVRSTLPALPVHSNCLICARLIPVSLLLLLSAVSLVAAAYQPVAYSATALLGSRLYIYGGMTNLSSPAELSSQFATVSLANGFDTDDVPWEFLRGYIPIAKAPAAPSRDQRRFILTGSRNNLGHGAAVFDSSIGNWSQAPDLPGASADMRNFRRDLAGVTVDTSTGLLIEFGGYDDTNVTNQLSLLDTSKATGMMNWSYAGVLDSVPALNAPIVTYLPALKLTVIMGGCDQVDSGGNPSHCVAFDTLYTISSSNFTSASPVASRVSVQGTALPAPRLLPCTVLLPDNSILMMGGGDPNMPLSDAWILNTQTWSWSPRTIGGFPSEGLMGHSCELGAHGQILVVGGHHGDTIVNRPLSVIDMRSWTWTGRYNTPGFSKGVMIGLALTVVVVVGAIGAGLWIRRRRNKMARLDGDIKMKNSSRHKKSGGRSSSRSVGDNMPKRGSRSGPQLEPSEQHHELEGVQSHSGIDQPVTLPGNPLYNEERHLDRAAGAPPSVDPAERSSIGSPCSTVVDPSSPRLNHSSPERRQRQQMNQ